MPNTPHLPDVFPPYRGYVHATEVSAGSRLLFISGLNGFESDGRTIPSYDEPNVRMRQKHLGSHRLASTVICCRLLEPTWKLEVEAVAAA